MRERPILFSTPMVRAILAGQKTQTRRVMKPQPVERYAGHASYGRAKSSRAKGIVFASGDPSCADWRNSVAEMCPFGQPGDHLWVREAWKYSDWTDDGQPYVEYAASPEKKLCENIPEEWSNRLLDTWASLSAEPNYAIDQRAADRRWRPSIHMPRWASRITLEVTGVRVERLQDISEADAKAEGVESPDAHREDHDWSVCSQCGGTLLYTSLGPNLGVCPDTDCYQCDTHAKRFCHLWASINGTESWDANPWIWVIEFKRVTP